MKKSVYKNLKRGKSVINQDPDAFTGETITVVSEYFPALETRQHLSRAKFIDYFKLISSFAKTKGCEIVFFRDEDDGEPGVFNPLSKQIFINGVFSRKEKLATILHEVGHLMDYNNRPRLFKSRRLQRALASFELNPNMSRRDRDLIMDIETKAWLYARQLAKELDIRLDKSFDDTERNSLCFYANQCGGWHLVEEFKKIMNY